MIGQAEPTLLAPDDPSPVRVANSAGASLFLLVGDHAGNRVPRHLANLGLDQHHLQRHIALDIGISRLGKALSARLDAPFLEQRYSRLVIDCNRARDSVESVAASSDGTAIPANAHLSAEDKARREAEIFEPYHARIAAFLQARDNAGTGSQPGDSVLVSLHSFTPALDGTARPWDIGVLHAGGDSAFARALLQQLVAAGPWCIGDNEPYRMDDTDFTIPHHAYPKRRRYAELEIRQDLLDSEEDVARMAALLATALAGAAAATGA